ncbi:HAMP domain-containing protein [Noviherbaspirillum cavernae]|uniref:HAMP domain-containing protein n=1 Tax=Noviherbaspirillum cavernae TaxID=2320862 RepID=A0A418X5A1_9BURK|nr:methyl-accepting chemotaxis protein [Noviherbaspirillum cavernae]RJG07663.1 HAMP domain-containing protein [Noviherbaspirillum cavernae]
MKFTDMKIGAKLGLAFGFVLLFLIGTTILATISLADLNAGTERIVKTEWSKSKLAMQALDNARGSITRVLQLTAETDDKESARARERLAANAAAFNNALDKLDPMLTRAENRAVLTKAKESSAKYVAAYGKTLTLLGEGKREDATRQAFTEVYPALQTFAENLRELNELQQQVVEAAGTQSEQTFRSTRAIVIALGVIAVLVGVLCAWLVSRAITQPLNEAVRIAQTVAAGDLTSRIEVRSKDETGLLLRALKEMNESLVRIVGEVRSGTDTIATASAQIASGNLDLSSRTEEQAGSLEETASSMEELTSTVKQNTENARQANGLAASASEVASKGGAVVSQVVDTMGSINESSKKIVDIISVIDGIAFQTNILALNAAVEAARAGEQGRGFAVVASEVRSLAQRSASAAKEIKSLIDDSVDKVDAGTRLVDQAGATMQEIVDSVRRVTDIISEIAAASDEQQAGIEQINQAVVQMDQVTQQNASLVEEAAAAADSMQEQSRALAQAVSVFRLNGMQAVAPVKRVATKPAAAPVAKPVIKHTRTTALPSANATSAKAMGGGEWEEF